ncbi:MAG: hypothetical protein IPF82_03620 [Blastocatellia bacterium]|nr:hypothetical protein [Blastocatellia bacterium]
MRGNPKRRFAPHSKALRATATGVCRYNPRMVILVFVDGVGIGRRGLQNPLDGVDSPYFSVFENEAFRTALRGAMAITDTRLGVEGLPQSATGQTTIITGLNAAAHLGRHLSAFPGGSLRPLLESSSLFRTLSARGLRTAHANVAPSTIARRRVRTVSATAIAAESAGLPLRTLDDLASGRALHHEFTNASLRAYGFDVEEITPAEAGRRLAEIAAGVDFCAFEYFLTDAAGHDADFAAARSRIAQLDEFLDALLSSTDLDADHVLLTSDHGNLEDLSSGSHTLNPVATTVWGPEAADVASSIRSLADIAPAVAALAV